MGPMKKTSMRIKCVIIDDLIGEEERIFGEQRSKGREGFNSQHYSVLLRERREKGERTFKAFLISLSDPSGTDLTLVFLGPRGPLLRV